jgi:energy-coupling factor transporter ATP-binding protein EcfA2
VNGQRPDLGIVFQNPDLQLFNATVREEILYRLPDPRMDRYTGLVGVLGLSRYEETPPLLLSEGEKKRVALATVLMRGPHHGVLLDEPALGQDVAHKDHLMRIAHALADMGQLIILTTHDLTLAAQADRLMVLGPDGFEADGLPADVLRDGVVWKRVGLRVPEWVLCSPSH